MSTIQSRFKTITKAAVIAIALGASAVTTLPAMAQEAPSQFSLQLPGGQGQGEAQTFGAERRGGGGGDRDWGYRCLTNREVRQGIGAYGFRRVEVVREMRRDRVEVRAQYGRSAYSMRVDKCSGEVDQIRRLRYGNGGGFGFQFNFGN